MKKLLVLLSLLTVACADAPADEVLAPDQPGRFAVGYTFFSVTDAERANRPLGVHLWFPTDQEGAPDATARYRVFGPVLSIDSEVAFSGVELAGRGRFPLVVFSHGYPSFGAQSPALVETLASHGFVVASPDHTGSTYVDDSDSLGVAATRRVPDVKFLIDEILRRSQSEDDLLSGSIDADAIAVVGNSFGGSTAMGVAAGWAGASADPRVKAVVPISGVIDATGWSFDTFDAEELGAVRVPVMLIGATEDENVPIENNEYAFDGLVGSRAVYQVNVVGANHYHFAGVCTFIDAALALGISWSLIGSLFSMQRYDETCGPDAFPAEQAFRVANLYTIAFLKRHLEGDERYSRYLTSAYADTEPDVEFRSRVAESP